MKIKDSNSKIWPNKMMNQKQIKAGTQTKDATEPITLKIEWNSNQNQETRRNKI